MKFATFLKLVPKIKNSDLPGVEAQLKMAPPFRKSLLKRFKAKIPYAKSAAVLVLCYPDSEGETHFVLILRKTYKGVHSAQVGFPGGKPEPEDTHLEATALRETWEEVGVEPHLVQIVRSLTDLYIPPSNFQVYPFFGISDSPLQFVKQDSEVDAIISVALEELLDDSNETEILIKNVQDQSSCVPSFKIKGHRVWGATAMMLMEVKTLINHVQKK
jgi:8-oxo-dGTP pyrophosphatase MutT (NUDIX family)